MKRSIRYLSLIILLLAVLSAHAGPKKTINEIKQDLTYIFGEATKADASEAYNAALNILQSGIQKWYEEKDKKNTGKVIRDMTFLADTVHAMRGDFHRVFAYVSISQLEETLQADENKVSEMVNRSSSTTTLSSAMLDSDPRTSGILQQLVSKDKFQDFATAVTEYKKDDTITEASRGITQKPSNGYLAVFNKAKKGEPLLHLLVLGQGQPSDLLSGRAIDIEIDYFIHNREKYRLLWFVLNNSNNHTKEQ